LALLANLLNACMYDSTSQAWRLSDWSLAAAS